MSAENVYSAFKKIDISPFNRYVISKACTMPADAFIANENCENVEKETPDNAKVPKHVDEYPNQSMNAKSQSLFFKQT